MKIFKKIFLIILVVSCLVGCDYSSKRIANKELKGKSVQSYLGGTLKFYYVENQGGMLGFGDKLSEEMRFLIFTIFVALTLLTLLFFTILKKGGNKISIIGLLLILSGGIGNLIDRIINDGRVIDFVIVGMNNLHSGIFNIADLYITTGVVIFILSEIPIKRKVS